MSVNPQHYTMARRAGGGFALIPNHVAAAQVWHDENKITFGAHPCDSTGRQIPGEAPFRAILRGDLYGLHTTGTGDITIANA